MKKAKQLNKFLILVFSLVWLVKGLICKILNLVPRHQEIVAEILGQEYAREITFLIGLGELGCRSGFFPVAGAILVR